MSERKITGWFTMNGKHIPIFEGESKADAVNRSIAKDNEDKKQADIQRNKDEAKKFNAIQVEQSKQATTQIQSEHRKAIADLSSDKYEDGTYDIKTKKAKEFPNGYQATFCQIGDDYSDKDYAGKVNECLKISSDGNTYAGKFGGTPEISFHCKDKQQAIDYASKNNQVSIWDWENGLTIKTGGTGIQPKEFGLSNEQYNKVLNYIHSKPKYHEQFNDILDSDNYVPEIKAFVKKIYNSMLGR